MVEAGRTSDGASVSQPGLIMSVLSRFMLPLRFDDRELEARFASDYSDRFVIQLRFALVLAVLLMLGDAAVDFAFDQQPALRANMIRIFGIIPVLSLSFALTYWRPFRRFLEPYCVLIVMLTAAGMFWAMHQLEIDGGMGLSSWVGPLNYTFVMVFVFLILGVRFIFALPLAVVVTGSFLAMTELTLTHTAGRSLQHIYHVITVFLLCAFLGYWREYYVRRAFRADFELQREREKTDTMLFDLIPHRIVEQLKEREPPIAESFAEATVVFADIVGFTKLSTRVGPEHLLEILDRIFGRFDQVCLAHQVEKVKTIGDAYMAIAFQSQDGENGAARAIRSGLGWLAIVDELGKELGQSIDLRIGAHTGPVIGGVIGSRRWSYDYWGDTVNVASGIEAACAPGHMTVSEATYWRARADFDLKAIGPVAIKGNREFECYTVAPTASASAGAVATGQDADSNTNGT